MNNSEIRERVEPTPEQPNRKGRLRAFWDFFVLFSGISTRSNLSRTRREPVQSRGLFLFRKPGRPQV
jgi:hypothetical protein